MDATEELDILMERYLAFELSGSEEARLLCLLDESTEAAQRFYEQVRTDAQISELRRFVEASGPDISGATENLYEKQLSSLNLEYVSLLERTSPSSPKKERTKTRPNDPGSLRKETAKRRVFRWGTAMTLCAGLLLLFGIAWYERMERSLETGAEIDPLFAHQNRSLPQIRENADPVWNDPDLFFRFGERIFSRPLQMLSGLTTLVYEHGSRITIEGDSSFETISDNRITADRGRFQFEITPQGRDFSAVFPEFTAIVKGTRFSTEIKEGVTELHLFEGRLDIEDILGVPAERMTLESGQSIRVSKIDGVVVGEAESNLVLTRDDVENIYRETQRKEYSRWVQASRTRLRDAALLALLDFETTNTPPTVAGSNKPLTTGITTGCEKSRGRWPDKQGLTFRSREDQVSMTIPGTFDSLTLTASLRVDATGDFRNNIFGSQGRTPHGISWSITDQGNVVFALWDKNTYSYVSPVPLFPEQIGHWIHLAVVVDGSDQRITHYFNGKRVSSERLRAKIPLVVGHAALGKTDDMGVIRFFDGGFDEFRIYRKALPAADVRKIARGER